MEENVEEALKAKKIAEKRFAQKDFRGALKYALKAKNLCPGLEDISQMVATFDVYLASEIKYNGETDYFSILGLKPFVDRDVVKKQYRKMAVLLHPDKNKTVGADGAFKLVSEAWTVLSDSLKRNKQSASCIIQSNSLMVHTAAVTSHSNCCNSSITQRLDTFWTVCTSCKVQYEYLRKYVNKKLSCKNCRGTFIAVETGTAPVTGSFPYSHWSYIPGNGYGNHSYDAYATTTPSLYARNGVSGLHTGHEYGYASNVSYQWGSFSGSSGMIPSGSASLSADDFYQVNANGNDERLKVKADGHPSMNVNPNLPTGCNEFSSVSKAGKPNKRRKFSVATSLKNGHEENRPKSPPELKMTTGNTNAEREPKLRNPSEPLIRHTPAAPSLDVRKLLIGKAKTEIHKQLEQIRLASAATAANRECRKSIETGEAPKEEDSVISSHQPRLNPVSITVPDPDFHDFDKDRAEECFQPKQIWAIYDEDDGMPRLYCLIREIFSVKPFKILITYLNSKTQSEFGSMNWIDSGFTKSCGHFRAWTTDVVEQVNIFSHLLKGEKAGRGGCVRIFPKCGDIWAVYRNWSTDWDSSTPDDVRHQYEMVEVLEDYSEDLGVWVIPLVKLAGFKTVYQRMAEKDAVRWIPRQEMFRFSHQVPSWPLRGEESNKLPDKCWDLDPAATPDELLHGASEAQA